jgi:MYXO-CTERM domain-containing protein
MGLRRIVLAFSLFLAAWTASEKSALATPCITSNGCSGTTPTCDLLSFSCRGCASDLDCGAPLSGDVCMAEGPQKGSCVSASDAGARNCSMDSECDSLGGYVCSGVTCVLGCKVTIFGDTCLIGAHCILPISVGFSIGTCSPASGGGGGGGDASSPGCKTDGDCDLSAGLVCVQGDQGGSCEPGCHASAAGDTCPSPTKCSVTGGGLGVCRQPSADGGPSGCTTDPDCLQPGLVCVASQCVIGCHDTSAGDTCPGGTMCSVMGGGLGTCVAPGTDAGLMVCSVDANCPAGEICQNSQCVAGCRVTDAGDSCPSGAMCSVVSGSLGVCTGMADGGNPGGGPTTPCAVDADCNGGLVCVSDECVVGCRETDAGTEPCLLGTGGQCTVADGGSTGECVGSDGGVTPGCTLDGDCPHGLVCDTQQCVVGCHDTAAAGDTCDSGSMCSVQGGALGVCIGTGPDGGATECTQDPECPQGEVCDHGECVVGCHDVVPVDTCAAPMRCDAVGGSLGVCVGGDDGGASSDDGGLDGSSGPLDATTRDGSADGAAGGEPTFEGGGCSCNSSPASPAEGGGVAFLIALTVLFRRRTSK